MTAKDPISVSRISATTGGELSQGHYDLIWVGSVLTHLPEAASHRRSLD
jgi:hypothetical protein